MGRQTAANAMGAVRALSLFAYYLLPAMGASATEASVCPPSAHRLATHTVHAAGFCWTRIAEPRTHGQIAALDYRTYAPAGRRAQFAAPSEPAAADALRAVVPTQGEWHHMNVARNTSSVDTGAQGWYWSDDISGDRAAERQLVRAEQSAPYAAANYYAAVSDREGFGPTWSSTQHAFFVQHRPHELRFGTLPHRRSAAPVYKSAVAPNTHRCMAACKRSMLCYAFTYHYDTRRCRLHSEIDYVKENVVEDHMAVVFFVQL